MRERIFLERLATGLRDQLAEIEATLERERQRERRYDISALRNRVLEHHEYLQDHGLKEEQATQRCEALFSHKLANPRTVKQWIEDALSEGRVLARARRDREIMRLMRRGYTNKEIATAVAHLNGGKTLHDKSVSRIIGKRLSRELMFEHAAESFIRIKKCEEAKKICL